MAETVPLNHELEDIAERGIAEAEGLCVSGIVGTRELAYYANAHPVIQEQRGVDIAV